MTNFLSLLRSILQSVALAASLAFATAQAAPSITDISPSSGPSQGGTTVTINGSGFGASPLVILNGNSMPLTASTSTSTRIIATTPAGEGTGGSVVVFANGQSSNAINFAYQAPSITTVSPALVSTAGGTTITLTGSSFGINSSITVNGSPVSTITRSHTQITFNMPEGQGSGLPIVVAAAGQSSPSAPISYAPPLIAEVSPASGPTQGNIPITITGSNFGISRTVTIGGKSAALISGTHTQLVVTAPAGQGTDQAVVVSSGGQTSNTGLFNYSPPAITGITPASGPTGGGSQITLTGSSFGLAPEVSFNGTTLQPTSATHTLVVFSLPPGQGSNLPITITTAGQSSSPIAFSYSPPSISSISPIHGVTKGGTRMTIVGNNFGVDQVVRIGGVIAPLAVPATHTLLEVTVPAGEGVNKTVTVETGGVISNPQFFSYDLPVLTAVSDTSFPTAGGATITLSGSNFGFSPTVTIGGSSATLVQGDYSHERIVCILPAGQGVNREVKVTAASQVSNILSLDYDPPQITAISPGTGPTAGNIPITIQGQNFGMTPTVSIGGINAPLASSGNSHTQLVVTLPSGQGNNKNVVVTVDGRQSNGVAFSYQAPQISAISHASAPTTGGTVITLTGSNFGASGLVTVNGATATLTGTGYSDTAITCLLPAGQGTDLPVVVSSGGQDSNPFLFSYDAPAITSITATSVPTAGGVPITVQGRNFGNSNTRVIFGSLELIPNPAASNHTQLVVTLPAGQGANIPLQVSVNGRLSAASTVGYDAPSLTSISPASGPTAGGTRITLSGNNFGLSPSITFGGKTVPLAQSGTHTTLFVDLPEGEGINQVVNVSVDGRTTGGLNFNYDPPTLTSISATSFPTSGGTVVTVTGQNFGLSQSITVNGNATTIVQGSSSHTSVAFLLPPGQGINLPVVLTSAGRNSPLLLLGYDPPLITSISAIGASTAGGTPITINGLNFGTSRTAFVGGNPIALTPASDHNRLIGTIPAGQGAGLAVTVRVDDRISNTVLFSYAPPVITAVSATSAPTSGGTTITLTGSGFGASPSVSLNGITVGQLVSSSHSSIRFVLPAGQGTDLPLVVSAGNQNSAPLSFSYDAPLLTAISPTTGPTAGGTRITLTGGNFGRSPIVLIGGNVAPIDAPSAQDRIVATIPAGGGAGLPVRVSVQGRPSNSLFFSYLPPTITSVTPNTGPIAGGTTITINGENFGTAPSLLIGGKPVAQFISQTHERITCILPPGSGQNKSVIVTAVGQVSNTALFSYETRSFADWAASISWNGLDSSPGADPRNTGWKNSLSYAFGVDPTTAMGGETASRNPPVRGRPAFTRHADGSLQLSFWRRRSEVYPDLSYQVQFSADPGVSSWEPSSLPPQVETVDGEWEFCTFTDHSAGAERFGRVQIGVQP